MNIITAYSTKESSTDAVNDIKEQFGNFDTKMILFFSSTKYHPTDLAEDMKTAFPEATTFGCTTAGEIVTGKMLNNSVVAMAFNSEVIDDVKVEVVENIKDMPCVKEAFTSFENYYGVSSQKMDHQEYVGLILIDGISQNEEKIMDQVGDLTNVFFVGGSAGDDLKFDTTYAFANGKAYPGAALLALIKPKVKFGFIKTQSFCPLNQKFTATKVNEETREIVEFDHRPAGEVYTEAVGISVEEAPDYFMLNPLGLMIDDEPYVRSPREITEQKSMRFYCSVVEGMELTLLETDDIIGDTQKAIDDKEKEMGSLSGIVNFNCLFRTFELQKKELVEAYANIFSKIPTVGFSTYGEEFLGHVNQTATILVFE